MRNSKNGSYYLSKVNEKLTQRSITKLCVTKLRNNIPTRLLNFDNKGLSAFSEKKKKKKKIALLEPIEDNNIC